MKAEPIRKIPLTPRTISKGSTPNKEDVESIPPIVARINAKKALIKPLYETHNAIFSLETASKTNTELAKLKPAQINPVNTSIIIRYINKNDSALANKK